MKRYTEYCQKTGTEPQWSNVYNQVVVTISNSEFGEISTKEVQAAKYLDMLETVKVTNYLNINESFSFEQIMVAGQIGVESAINNQVEKTPLFLENEKDTLKLA